MTLKEKFEEAFVSDLRFDSENAVVIAERFAKDILRVFISNKTLQYKQSQGEYSMDELLLIIKKEINL
jgi:hypothetical protein